ncbi:ABC transporter ATP-binding protein (plasmid) [Sulfitobacter sp. W002]|uniref:ABC transporter ATP-binding protein n=1 Tax=Sulfitobacter sp. W002 TaxID=2867024 RepID=UPI0021A2A56D|nr:ABC transporter ATP-binding protein [Sulfitobacter sp. W002]UWR31923.1 ABC transporter ATP-binding protein [Sulfitobacter sp. W002]
MIAATDITAGYGNGADILHGISIEAHARELVTILGPNGCGKSTLLKTVAGFVKPRRGRIEFGGDDVGKVPIHEKVRSHAVGYVPQSDNVFGTLTVAENILMGARGLERETRERRFTRLMERYPALSSKLRRKASALSGGERQILSLARALMAGPRILLLDEPSAGLSPSMMHDVFDEIAQIRDEQDMCILMVEQNAYEALTVADRAYVLTVGKVAMSAKAVDLLNDPAMEKLYLGGDPDE